MSKGPTADTRAYLASRLYEPRFPQGVGGCHAHEGVDCTKPLVPGESKTPRPVRVDSTTPCKVWKRDDLPRPTRGPRHRRGLSTRNPVFRTCPAPGSPENPCRHSDSSTISTRTLSEDNSVLNSSDLCHDDRGHHTPDLLGRTSQKGTTRTDSCSSPGGDPEGLLPTLTHDRRERM